MPVLGICYGFQVLFLSFFGFLGITFFEISLIVSLFIKLINKAFGGTVSRERIREDCQKTVRFFFSLEFLDGIKKMFLIKFLFLFFFLFSVLSSVCILLFVALFR